MRTLDDILTEQTRAAFEGRLASAIDPSNWTPETRDDSMADVFDLSGEIAEHAETFVRRMLEPSAEGESGIYLTVRREMLIGIAQILQGMRAQLDEVSDEEAAQLPYDAEWLTGIVRRLLIEIRALTARIDKAAALPEVEEL